MTFDVLRVTQQGSWKTMSRRIRHCRTQPLATSTYKLGDPAGRLDAVKLRGIGWQTGRGRPRGITFARRHSSGWVAGQRAAANGIGFFHFSPRKGGWLLPTPGYKNHGYVE